MACKTCKRALLPEHEDENGNCCFCAEPKKPAKKKELKKKADKK